MRNTLRQLLTSFQVDNIAWNSFHASVKAYFRRLEPVARESQFYLKIRSKDTSLQSYPAGPVLSLLAKGPQVHKEMLQCCILLTH
jgi:hypothetical protein